MSSNVKKYLLHFQERGIFIHSLKLDDHLKVLTNKAKFHRKQNTKIGFGFTALEKKLMKQFNISDQIFIVKADAIEKELSNVNQKLKGRDIHKAIDQQFKDND